MNFDRYWNVLESVQSHIRAFDTKAQIAIGLNGILIGFLLTQLAKVMEYWSLEFLWRLDIVLILAGLALLCSISAVLLGVRVVHPQLDDLNQPYSRFFFCHLAERFGRDWARAAESLEDTSAESSLREVTSQIAVNSFVCNVKAKRCKPVLRFTAAAFVLYAVSVVPFISLESSAAKLTSHPTNQALIAINSGTYQPALGIGPSSPYRYATPMAMIVGALLALSGVVVTFMGGRQNAKEQNGLASRMKLADFRETWINRLRDSIAELESVVGSEASGSLPPRALELAVKVRLLMNRKDIRYPQLTEALDRVTSEVRTDVPTGLKQLERCVQDILKEEWTVLKNDLDYKPPLVQE